MYLNENKIKSTLARAKVQMIVGIIFVVFFGFAIVSGILEPGNLRKNLPFYIVMILPFIWLVWLSIQKKRMVEKARQLNQMFRADADGDIKASHLVQTLRSKNEYQAIEMVRKLIGKGLLKDCTVEQEPYLHVYLYKSAAGNAAVTTSVMCPSCGASVEKRKGFSTTCPYCGTKIS